jgi:hypothetical protein
VDWHIQHNINHSLILMWEFLWSITQGLLCDDLVQNVTRGNTVRRGRDGGAGRGGVMGGSDTRCEETRAST